MVKIGGVRYRHEDAVRRGLIEGGVVPARDTPATRVAEKGSAAADSDDNGAAAAVSDEKAKVPENKSRKPWAK